MPPDVQTAEEEEEEEDNTAALCLLLAAHERVKAGRERPLDRHMLFELGSRVPGPWQRLRTR